MNNKPIGTTQRQVGNTYGERRNYSTGNLSSEPQISKNKEFGSKVGTDGFAANAQFIKGKNNTQGHRIVEAGKAHPKATITDERRVAFLDSIIAEAGENKPPRLIKA